MGTRKSILNTLFFICVELYLSINQKSTFRVNIVKSFFLKVLSVKTFFNVDAKKRKVFYLSLVCLKVVSGAFSGDHSSLNYLTTSLHLKTCPLPVYKSLIVWYFLAKIPCFYFFLVFFFIFQTKQKITTFLKVIFITFNSLNVCLIEESTL